ncbi:hypothetical protein [Paenibacillus whitsoniae]|uniref:Uncharacterized protein n=1 Tax=Paenibacillus whitsoniae TaxID=2496558 RepID=A0A3S0C5K4_9BACL|nr:hypothetical protein [Paenibacillus whitsoniae]RTE04239.1 hypothetical protein EJQ19_26830 [Paenibacillus whitsoniae]
MSDKVVLSTGVLTREPGTITAVVNLVNLERRDSHRVIVEVWDWSSYSTPTKLPVLIGDNVPVIFPYRLAAQNLAVMYADLDETVDLYEVRITLPDEEKVIANCFGRSLPPYASQEGNTVLQKQLVKIN